MKKVIIGCLFTLMSSLHVSAQEDCAPTTEIVSQEDLDAFVQNVTCVEGNLTFLRWQIEPIVVNIPRLTRVTGSIAFGGELISKLEMKNLRSVGGNISISTASYPNSSLVLVKMPKLEDFRGDRIDIVNATSLENKNVVIHKNALQKVFRQ